MTMCVKKDGRKSNAWGKEKNQSNKKEKGKIPSQIDVKKESVCFSIRKGHIKKKSTKFHKWLEKKGILILFLFL